MDAPASRRSQEAAGPDAASQETVELVLHKRRRIGTSGGLSPLEEGRSMPLHQAVQRGVSRAVAPSVNRGATRLPFRLLKWSGCDFFSRGLRLDCPE